MLNATKAALLSGLAVAISVVVIGAVIVTVQAQQGAARTSAAKPPVYRVDPFWPKPLPHKWSMQQIVDMYIDRDDHVFMKQFWVHPSTQSRGPKCGGIWSATDPPCGTVYHLALSTDPEQRYIFVADGTNNMVWILNRQTGALEGSFGGNGRYAGQLHWIDAVHVDSKGNVYTGEVEDGKRIQKFVRVN